jgi:hypothetical protein
MNKHSYQDGNKAGYQTSGGGVKVTDMNSNGMAGQKDSKAPSYGMMPREISLKKGFSDVKSGKI